MKQSALFDADGDGDLDLLITYGDTRYDDTSVSLSAALVSQ